HADAPDDAGIAQSHAHPPVAVEDARRAYRRDAWQIDARAVDHPLGVAPVACVNGFSNSVVEVTSENSFGLVGPTLIRAFSVPSVACHRPSSFAAIVERQVPGSPALSANSRVAPVGDVTVTGATLSAMVWRSTTSS